MSNFLTSALTLRIETVNYQVKTYIIILENLMLKEKFVSFLITKYLDMEPLS